MQQSDFMVIDFDPQGVVTAMHRDEFSLGFLGKQEIERASEIKFDEVSQSWEVQLPIKLDRPLLRGETSSKIWGSAKPAQGFATYNGARKFEVLWLEHCALQTIAPLSAAGIFLAETLRATYKESP